eukprot:221362_1
MSSTGTITAIDKESIARICSGQVVADLASTVKELVENSLDAGATHIEVKLQGSGADGIEVSDNGSGIDPKDYDAICRKYHTSKLRTFDGLGTLQSFGFRGEAINAICELSGGLVVITRTGEEDEGCRLTYDVKGKLIKKQVAPRPVGTTIIVEQLFKALPVRRLNFTRGLKKHLNKMLRFLQAYAVISVGVRLTVTDKPKTGGTPSRLLGTQNGATLKDNIATVYGAKQLSMLQPVSIKLGNGRLIEGMISKAGTAGSGRSDNSRQFLYVNGRPVDLPSVTRVLNEAWRHYEMKAKPIALLNLKLPVGSCDINVTPDKREVIVEHEAEIAGELKQALHDIWGHSSHSLPLAAVSTMSQTAMPDFLCRQKTSERRKEEEQPECGNRSITGLELPKGKCPADDERGMNGGGLIEKDHHTNVGYLSSTMESAERVGHVAPAHKTHPHKLTSVAGVALSSSNSDKDIQTCSLEENYKNIVDLKLTEGNQRKGHSSPPSMNAFGFKGSEEEHDDHNMAKTFTGNNRRSGTIDESEIQISQSTLKDSSNACLDEPKAQRRRILNTIGNDQGNSCISGECSGLLPEPIISDPLQGADAPSARIIVLGENIGKTAERSERQGGGAVDEIGLKTQAVKEDDGPGGKELISEIPSLNKQKRSREWMFNPEAVCLKPKKQGLNNNDTILNSSSSSSSQENKNASMKANASVKQTDGDAATQALSFVLSKEQFAHMRVVGQFNLGFIIASLESDLFILDQHACDEKYNFEVLQKETVIHQQPLVRPMALQATAAEEEIIMDHLSVFEKNGFFMNVDHTAMPMQRVMVKAMPFSKNTQFGVSDIHELTSIVSLDPTRASEARLPKVRSMFAMRACRTSIMIGKHLGQSEMQSVVSKLAKLDHPWNCPHGRPTLRHLADIARVSASHASSFTQS